MQRKVQRLRIKFYLGINLGKTVLIVLNQSEDLLGTVVEIVLVYIREQ